MVTQRRKATNMKKLSKSSEYAIQWLVNQNKNTVEISEELGLSEATVRTYIETNNISSTPITNPLPIKSSPVSSKDLMIRHTRDKQTNSVAIMTKEASEKNDANRPKFKNTKANTNHIFKPNKS